MESTSLAIAEIGGILLLAAGAGFAARAARLPAIVGYIVVGLLVSPFTPGYVADRHQIQLLADLGVVFLLFEVGIEIDLRRLGRRSARLLVAVPIQVLISAAAGYAAAIAMGAPAGGAALIGLAVALSSSVVVVNITRSRRRTASDETAEQLLGWSVVQDLAGTGAALVVIAFLGLEGRSVVPTLLRMVAFLGVTVAFAGLLPVVLRRLHGEPDLFLVASVSSALVIAGLGAEVFGVPIALGAFVGGLALGESREASAARQRLLPFRDLFAVLFFVAVGTLFDPLGLDRAWAWALLVVGLVVVAKAVPAFALAHLLEVPNVDRSQLAVGLAQVGEFSFVLASLGEAHGLLPPNAYDGVLAAVVLTIPLSSVLARVLGPGARSTPVREGSTS